MHLWDRDGIHLLRAQSSTVCQHEQHFIPAPCRALMLAQRTGTGEHDTHPTKPIQTSDHMQGEGGAGVGKKGRTGGCGVAEGGRRVLTGWLKGFGSEGLMWRWAIMACRRSLSFAS